MFSHFFGSHPNMFFGDINGKMRSSNHPIPPFRFPARETFHACTTFHGQGGIQREVFAQMGLLTRLGPMGPKKGVGGHNQHHPSANDIPN